MALVKEDGYAYVSRIYKKGRGKQVETSKNESIKLKTRRLPEGVVPGEVRVGLSQTINLGNFESVKVDVGITLPALKEEVKDAYIEALTLCKQYLAANVKEVIEARDEH